MLRRLWLIALLAPAFVACGDGDDDPAEEDAGSAYYTRLAELTQDMDEANTAADQELNDALPTTEPGQIGNLFSEATRESAERLETTLEEMAELEPPEGAQAAHEELLDATRAELELSREFATTWPDWTSRRSRPCGPRPSRPTSRHAPTWRASHSRSSPRRADSRRRAVRGDVRPARGRLIGRAALRSP